MYKSITIVIIASLSITALFFYNSVHAQGPFHPDQLIEKQVVAQKDTVSLSFLHDPYLSADAWDTLSQPAFWRKIMELPSDSALLNVASTRKILQKIHINDWNALSDDEKPKYKQKAAADNGLPEDTRLFITTGKREFYTFRSVMPSIDSAVRIFKAVGTDPWYAQAILLIESPGKLRYSSVGAYGPFQLMKGTARIYGLTVNKTTDERNDFQKSAKAAAKLIRRACVPEIRQMLDDLKVPYKESDTWFRLLVMHAYHAGSGNVRGVLETIAPSKGGTGLMQKVWQTEYKGFKNQSQNYSQIALASLMRFNDLICNDNLYLTLSEGDERFRGYEKGGFGKDGSIEYLKYCIAGYESDLVSGIISFDFFSEKIRLLEQKINDRQSTVQPKTAFSYPFDEKETNRIGYRLLRSYRTDEALDVFKLNAEAFPDSFNVYDSLGEVYRKKGEKELAVKYYKQSLELNHANKFGIRALKELENEN